MKWFQFLSARVLCVLCLYLIELLCLAALNLIGVQLTVIIFFLVAACDAIFFYLGILRPYITTKQAIHNALMQKHPEQEICHLIGFCPEEQRLFQVLKRIMEHVNMVRMDIRESELLALQNQINPHFLYNTLEAIRSDALIYGANDIAVITESLATYFRYTISALDRTVPLREELHNIEDYFTIQRYRFGDELKIDIHYSENHLMSETLYIPKMTLQPLVENAIFHGIEPCENLGSITIWIDRTPDVLLICVEDNGVGMDEEQVQKLNASLEKADDIHLQKRQKHGIALRNVHHRIQLLFGQEYGLHILSAPGFGTEAWLTFPVCTEAQEYEM